METETSAIGNEFFEVTSFDILKCNNLLRRCLQAAIFFVDKEKSSNHMYVY